MWFLLYRTDHLLWVLTCCTPAVRTLVCFAAVSFINWQFIFVSIDECCETVMSFWLRTCYIFWLLWLTIRHPARKIPHLPSFNLRTLWTSAEGTPCWCWLLFVPQHEDCFHWCKIKCPCGLPGVLCRWFIYWFLHCVYRLLVYIVCFPLILFSSLFSLSFPVRIDPLHFQTGGHKRRTNLGFFSCFSLFYIIAFLYFLCMIIYGHPIE